MCENQSLPTTLPFIVRSMKELFEYINENILDPFDFNSSINGYDEILQGDSLKIYTNLITVENFPSVVYKSFDDSNSGGAMHSQRNFPGHAFDSKTSDDPESLSIGKTSSPLNENNADAGCFNDDEWIIEDSASLKMRPPKLCEFLHLLLNNPRYASYTSWVNNNEDLFKIHNPAKVASLWRKIKLRRTHRPMDYETFSRGIRYYYKSGLMIKTHRRHTYRFA
ncbi:unnamed protein product [Rotaria sp. Silwood2]|nr:unnamed protein product [Rotaria sp. Silwood2]CAF2502788.1 unnamed protein product [Rotaria sp. Silwood2]CAF3925579.1 unnamed protein product [Rotaria sp. Silwood2]CAF3932105.1 unnamed protein product [Rotaria sp. Silwood2]